MTWAAWPHLYIKKSWKVPPVHVCVGGGALTQYAHMCSMYVGRNECAHVFAVCAGVCMHSTCAHANTCVSEHTCVCVHCFLVGVCPHACVPLLCACEHMCACAYVWRAWSSSQPGSVLPAAFEDMLENPLNSTQWMNDPETGPVMLQISRIFQTMNRT